MDAHRYPIGSPPPPHWAPTSPNVFLSPLPGPLANLNAVLDDLGSALAHSEGADTEDLLNNLSALNQLGDPLPGDLRSLDADIRSGDWLGTGWDLKTIGDDVGGILDLAGFGRSSVPGAEFSNVPKVRSSGPRTTYRYFAHGSSPSSIKSIVNKVRAVSIHAPFDPKGSFFTHEILAPGDLANDLGFASAEQWAVHEAGSAGQIAIARIPSSVADDLIAKGLLKTRQVPGYPGFAPEWVFHPRALPALNRNASWTVWRQTLFP